MSSDDGTGVPVVHMPAQSTARTSAKDASPVQVSDVSHAVIHQLFVSAVSVIDEMTSLSVEGNSSVVPVSVSVIEHVKFSPEMEVVVEVQESSPVVSSAHSHDVTVSADFSVMSSHVIDNSVEVSNTSPLSVSSAPLSSADSGNNSSPVINSVSVTVVSVSSIDSIVVQVMTSVVDNFSPAVSASFSPVSDQVKVSSPVSDGLSQIFQVSCQSGAITSQVRKSPSSASSVSVSTVVMIGTAHTVAVSVSSSEASVASASEVIKHSSGVEEISASGFPASAPSRFIILFLFFIIAVFHHLGSEVIFLVEFLFVIFRDDVFSSARVIRLFIFFTVFFFFLVVFFLRIFSHLFSVFLVEVHDIFDQVMVVGLFLGFFTLHCKTQKEECN